MVGNWNKCLEYATGEYIHFLCGDDLLSEDCIEKKFEVIPLSYPVKEKNKNNWAYINYLQVGNLLMVPQLGIPEDTMAIEQIKDAVPDYINVIGIPSLEAVNKGGALNCISWNIDANI